MTTTFKETIEKFLQNCEKETYKKIAKLADKINEVQDELYAYTDHLYDTDNEFKMEFVIGEDVAPEFRCEMYYFIDKISPKVQVSWVDEADDSRDVVTYQLLAKFNHQKEWHLFKKELDRYIKLRIDSVKKSALAFETNASEVMNLLDNPDEASKSDDDTTDYHAVPLKQPDKFLEGDNIQVATSTLHDNYNRLEAQNRDLRAKIEQLETENAKLKDTIKKANKLGLDLVFTTWSGKDEA